ncbi:MAG TPA: hypothetical protein VED40_05790 [Azospirillaceae bacterium]|nr:hypothetical protein [Azospirillaceae bacterium]
MHILTRFAVLASAMAVSACSTIVEGTSQDIVVNTNPAGAACDLVREAKSIGRVESTPGTVKVQKTKHDITVVCTKDGFQQATFMNKSDVAGATVGNVLAGGLVGWAVDSATGADNKYTSPINITLVPATPTTGGAAAVAPPKPVESKGVPTS